MSPHDSPSSVAPRKLLPALIHPWVWTMAWRDSRSQRRRLLVFALAVVSGLTALTAIRSLKETVETAVDSEAKSLLGADLHIRSRQQIASDKLAGVIRLSEDYAQETGISSMMGFPKANAGRLVQVRGIEGRFPFYGDVRTEPAGAWDQMLAGGGVVLEPALLDQFDLKIGDIVTLGSLELPILGVIVKPAPRSNRFNAFAPEACLSLERLEETGLTGTGSLGFRHLYLKNIDPVQVAAIREQFAQEGWKFETPEDRRDSIGKVLDNFQQFLGIISMTALILGAIGVAGAISAHLARRTKSIAVLRCLGCPAKAAYAVYLVQSVILCLLSSLAGGGLGMILHRAVLEIFKNDLPVAVSMTPPWGILIISVLIGFAVCLAFILLPLSQITIVSPSMALRGESSASIAQKGKGHWFKSLIVRLLAPGFLALMLIFLAVSNIPDTKRAFGIVAGLGVVMLLLWLISLAIINGARKIVQPSWPYLIRQGLSNLHRPLNQTTLFVFSLGLGAFLLLTVLLARHAILEKISLTGTQDMPDIYLVDVQKDQIDGVTTLLEKLKLPLLESAPILTMRITSVKGVPVRALKEKGNVPEWVLRREFRSSYRAGLNQTETIIAGQWPSGNLRGRDTVALSLEEEIAKDLSVGLGDIIDLDVQGLPLKAEITSIRRVDWSRFNLNFFMLFTPGILDDAPGFTIMTTRIPEGMTSGELQRLLVRDFPNVSAIDLTLILETVTSIMEQIAWVIQFVVGFTLLSGVAIIAGSLMNGRDQRIKESVLLRTLGGSSRQILSILLIEYAALGFFSGLAGSVLAMGAYVPMSLWIFETRPWGGFAYPVVITASATALSILAGLALSRGVCTHPPLEILRSQAST